MFPSCIFVQYSHLDHLCYLTNCVLQNSHSQVFLGTFQRSKTENTFYIFWRWCHDVPFGKAGRDMLVPYRLVFRLKQTSHDILQKIRCCLASQTQHPWKGETTFGGLHTWLSKKVLCVNPRFDGGKKASGWLATEVLGDLSCSVPVELWWGCTIIWLERHHVIVQFPYMIIRSPFDL